jgi:6-phosphogluconolactonase (cycloisomerase 2 family)
MSRKIRMFGATCVAAGTITALAAPAEATEVIYVSGATSNTVGALGVGAAGALAPVTGSPFGGVSSPRGVTITPDGRHIFVPNLGTSGSGPDSVSAYQVGAGGGLTAVSGSPFSTGAAVDPIGDAVTPDGRFLYTANQNTSNVSGFSIAGNGGLTPTPVSPYTAGAGASAVAITPDGVHLYVTNQGAGTISGYSIESDGSLSPITGSPFADGGGQPFGITITPDGAHLYTGHAFSNNVSAFTIGAGGALTAVTGSPFAAGTLAQSVAASPDGRFLYASNKSSNNVSGFAIAADGSLAAVPGSPFAAGSGPRQGVFTPDGTRLYVDNDQPDNTISGYSVAGSGSLTPLAGSPFPSGVVQAATTGAAISPDQPPTAVFTAATGLAGQATSFEGGGSSASAGQSVARYDWDFGDGSAAANAGASPTHTYATPGTYTVSLTVSDDAGCSTKQVFTGQTMSCNGGPSAQVTHQVTISNSPRTLSIAKSGSGAGTVTSADGQINCGPACSHTYDDGTQVVLSATAAAGSKFSGWSGAGCSGTGTCQVAMSSDQAVTASFAGAPDTKIKKAKINQAANSATFKFAAIGAPKAKARTSTFQCALLKKAHAKPKFKRCKSPKKYKHLKPRKYVFEVRAVNSGATDPTPAKKKFKIS